MAGIALPAAQLEDLCWLFTWVYQARDDGGPDGVPEIPAPMVPWVTRLFEGLEMTEEIDRAQENLALLETVLAGYAQSQGYALPAPAVPLLCLPEASLTLDWTIGMFPSAFDVAHTPAGPDLAALSDAGLELARLEARATMLATIATRGDRTGPAWEMGRALGAAWAARWTAIRIEADRRAFAHGPGAAET